MVSARCKLRVKDELKKLGLHFIFHDLGEVEIMENLSMETRNQLKSAFEYAGFELIEIESAVLVEKIKQLIMEVIHAGDGRIKTSISEYLSDQLNRPNKFLADLFSEVHCITIEQFYMNNKIERIKEMIVYGDQSITEICEKMNYVSEVRLSTDFKQVTGLPLDHFKQLKEKRLISIGAVANDI